MKKRVKKLTDPEQLKKSIKKFLDITARDILAFGSLAMFILAIGRAAQIDYWNYVYQILFAGLILFILQLFVKSENHIARGIILFTFTTFFYETLIFFRFAAFLLILLYISSFYLELNKKQILTGTILGMISSLISYVII